MSTGFGCHISIGCPVAQDFSDAGKVEVIADQGQFLDYGPFQQRFAGLYRQTAVEVIGKGPQRICQLQMRGVRDTTQENLKHFAFNLVRSLRL